MFFHIQSLPVIVYAEFIYTLISITNTHHYSKTASMFWSKSEAVNASFLGDPTDLFPSVHWTKMQTLTLTLSDVDSEVVCLFIRPGDDQRSETEQHRGHLAEAAACGGVWRLRYEPHRQAETSCTTAAGPGWGHCFSIHKSQLNVGDSCVLHPQPQLKLRRVDFWKVFFQQKCIKMQS